MGRWVIAKDYRGELHFTLKDRALAYNMVIEREAESDDMLEALQELRTFYHIPRPSRPGSRKEKIRRKL